MIGFALWSIMPVDSVLKSGVVTGQQILDWLERELENTFSKDPTRRFAGRLVRFKGLFVKFTIANVANPRRRDINVHQVLTEYLAAHSPVAPVVEGRAVATDAPADLLSQVEGTTYRFR